MVKKYLLLSACCLFLFFTQAQLPFEDPHWSLDIGKSDEFSILNLARWKIYTAREFESWGMSRFVESHVIVNNGFLKLKTTKEKELLYFTGAICSRDSAYGYGYYEILAKIPFGTGFWPTFWLYRHDNGIYEEIDILDPPGDMPTNSNAFGIMDHLKPTPEIYRSHVYQIPDLSDGFHKIAMEWQKGSVIFYIDDQVIGAYCGNEVPKRSLYLFLNQQLGPYHTQLPDTNYKDHEPTPQTDNSLPQYFEIDYFRYYYLTKNCISIFSKQRGGEYAHVRCVKD